MKKRNPHRNQIIAKNDEAATFQAHALTMQTGTQAQAALAFEKIYNRYKDWVHYFILRTVGTNTEVVKDLTQEVFIKVFNRIDTYSPDYALSTWIHKIALNAIIDHKRKINVEVLSIEGLQKDFGSSNDESEGEAVFQIKDEAADTHGAYVASERKELVHKAISTVISSEKEKIVVNLFFMQGLSQEEIHIETKLPVSTIKTLVFRAKDKIKTFLVTESPDLLLMDRFHNKKLQASN